LRKKISEREAASLQAEYDKQSRAFDEYKRQATDNIRKLLGESYNADQTVEMYEKRKAAAKKRKGLEEAAEGGGGGSAMD